jgi:hypothetical protein
VEMGRPGWVLVSLASRPDDMLVIGAGRRGILARIACSRVSRYCLAHAHCPVLAVPPPELRRSRLRWMSGTGNWPSSSSFRAAAEQHARKVMVEADPFSGTGWAALLSLAFLKLCSESGEPGSLVGAKPVTRPVRWESAMTTPSTDSAPLLTTGTSSVTVPAPPSWPWRRAVLFLAGAAQLITISALVGVDPPPAIWAALLLAITPAPVVAVV